MIDLKCEKCGIDYQKPAKFKRLNDEHSNLFYRWSLTYCDSCRREREKKALDRLGEVIKSLAK